MSLKREIAAIAILGTALGVYVHGCHDMKAGAQTQTEVKAARAVHCPGGESWEKNSGCLWENLDPLDNIFKNAELRVAFGDAQKTVGLMLSPWAVVPLVPLAFRKKKAAAPKAP